MILNNADNIMIGDTTINRVCIGDEIVWDGAYKKVDFLKSTGTQCIETDIVPTYMTKFVLDAKFSVVDVTASNTVFFGIQASSCWYLMSLERGSSDPLRNCSFYMGFYYYSGIGNSFLIQNVDYSNRNLIIYDRPLAQFGQKSTTITEEIICEPMTLGTTFFGVRFASRNGAFNVGEMWLYGAKSYDNGVLTHELFPVERQSDGELGLFDAMTGKFYTNSGSGSFEKGGYVSS